ncbi:NADH-cytochrome b5 reductase 3 [Salpingoeca rosetta]|uniref:NADH-cytochrome b5 reductase n=1 Tax=Salpingoeca rosetta (strain ATCC 50818 / BSB-021) TaxID=946362 RepID=F2TY27_SALR5|nr:NADH-cytochrome b5 reductase 3 [Salpingoeca rosetta]EGD76286.1 NADH-cytochrome b5 reductase 3 [Salpingoeca rosetta]|eukprot:XP_004998461.1 NADH-cytochrome b5 reductase 3 [Salpingoeca rosetta]
MPSINWRTVGFVGTLAAGAGWAISIPAAIGALIAGLGGAFFMKVLFNQPVALDPSKKIPFPLESVTELTHDTKLFRFSLQSKDHKLGLPVGQHMNLVAKVDGRTVIRAYTPVSSDDDLGYFDLVVKVYRKNVHPKFPEGGKMSQYLETLKIGDTIDVRGPAGHITYLGNGHFEFADKSKKLPPRRRHVKKIGMMAGGTGITPMLQIIQDVLKHPNDKTEIHLIFANQTEQDILVHDQLEKCAKDPRVHIWYTLDRPPQGWKYSEGFIDEEMIRKHLPGPANDTQILMCGPPPMIKFACMPNLEKIGFTPDQIATF